LRVCKKCGREIDVERGEKWTEAEEGVVHWPECPKPPEKREESMVPTPKTEQSPLSKEEAERRLYELFTGTTLDGYIEAARVITLDKFVDEEKLYQELIERAFERPDFTYTATELYTRVWDQLKRMPDLAVMRSALKKMEKEGKIFRKRGLYGLKPSSDDIDVEKLFNLIIKRERPEATFRRLVDIQVIDMPEDEKIHGTSVAFKCQDSRCSAEGDIVIPTIGALHPLKPPISAEEVSKELEQVGCVTKQVHKHELLLPEAHVHFECTNLDEAAVRRLLNIIKQF
jgi:hypothetical protein